jgi:hypothetical protein
VDDAAEAGLAVRWWVVGRPDRDAVVTADAAAVGGVPVVASRLTG